MRHFHMPCLLGFQVTQHQSGLLDLHTFACEATLFRIALTHRETSSPHLFPLHLRFIVPCLPDVVQSITAVSLFFVFGHLLPSITSSAQNRSLAKNKQTIKKNSNISFFSHFQSPRGFVEWHTLALVEYDFQYLR